MNWNAGIRQFHRWVSIAFTLGVMANMAVHMQLKAEEAPPVWVGLLALIPMILLLVTGLYMFAQPHVAKWRGARRAG